MKLKKIITFAALITSCLSSFADEEPTVQNYYVDEDGNYYLGGGSFKKPAIDRALSVSDWTMASTIDGHDVYGVSADGFRWCTNVVKLTVPSTLNFTTVGNRAFSGCSKLVTINGFSAIEEIGDGAFLDDPVLSTLDATGLTSIPANAFANCPSILVVSSGTTTGEGRLAIGNCTTIGDTAFANSGVTTLSFSGTHIGSGAFTGCKNLSSITLTDSLVSIGSGAFMNCSSIPSHIDLGANPALTIGGSAFVGCGNIRSVRTPVAFDEFQKVFGTYQSITSVVISVATTSVAPYFFQNCHSLQTVSIGGVITSVGIQAFNGCGSLKAVPDLSNARSIGDGAFVGCESLTGVKLHSSQTNETNLARIGLDKSQLSNN